MGQPVSRIGDTSSHGGALVSTPVINAWCNDKKVCTIGAILDCPIHGPNPITSTPVVNIWVDGNKLSTIGATTQCGATISSGSPDTYAS
jgi:uncharacterized Zn-binding protein involved in type VI secretion